MAAQTVAIMGLGIMGGGMAGNLLKAGFPLTVYNRTLEKAEPFAAHGAKIADTPREAVQDADVIISMVGDDNASRGMWLGNDGALAAAKRGAILVESSTLSYKWTMELASVVAQQGCQYLDSPVTGSKEAARGGTLRLLVGGEADVLEKARPVLEKVSSDIIHFGPVGAGTVNKLINNMMAAVHIVALGEGITLAERAGMNMSQVGHFITNMSASASPIVKGKYSRMEARSYEDPDFALHWMLKDVTYALELAEKFELPLEMVKAAQKVLKAACDKGFAEGDLAAAVEAVRQS